MDELLKALQAALPSAVRFGDGLRLAEAKGAVRVIVPRAPHDPQIDHGLIIGFVPALGPDISLDACHLRARCRRSVDAIEAARGLAEGKDAEANATLLAVESVRQISEMWGPFLTPQAWVGPSVEELLRAAANAPPADVEPLLATIRAAAAGELGQRPQAREWLEIAAKATDLRVRAILGEVRRRLADA